MDDDHVGVPGDDTVPPDGCAAVSRTSGEPMAGTAPSTTGWVLVEQSGAWPPDAADTLQSAVLSRLAARLGPTAGGDGVRLQLIRRPGHHPAGSPTDAAIFLVHSGTDRWCERIDLHDTNALEALDPAVTTGDRPPGIGDPWHSRLLLVCTHGSRDRCCAVEGRPVATTLAARFGHEVWETSHVGGHRFAANVLVLPDGVLLGRLDTDSAPDLLDGCAADADPAFLRGRCGYAPAVQAAEVLARNQLGTATPGAAALWLVDQGAERWQVGLRVAVGANGLHDFCATIERRPLGHAVTASCGVPPAEDPGRFVLVALDRVDEPPD